MLIKLALFILSYCILIVIGDLVERCKQCLEIVPSDNIITRQEIAEQCVLTLLNVGEWEYLTKRHYNCFKLPMAIAYTCLDVNKFKGTKKSAKEVWDLGKFYNCFILIVLLIILHIYSFTSV